MIHLGANSLCSQFCEVLFSVSCDFSCCRVLCKTKASPKLVSMRITELQNELTMDLDVTPVTSIMNLFQRTNQQIFSGWKNELHINEKYHLGVLVIFSISSLTIRQHPTLHGACEYRRQVVLAAHEVCHERFRHEWPHCLHLLLTLAEGSTDWPS